MQAAILLGLALVLLVADAYTKRLQPFRSHVSQSFDLMYGLVGKTVHYMGWLYHDALHYRASNQRLRQQVLALRTALNRVDDVRTKNRSLAVLCGVPAETFLPAEHHDVQIAQVISITSDPFMHEIMINKGSAHGVLPGFTLADAYGVVGQVTEVRTATSRVLLISDARHAIPVRVHRNHLNLVLEGASDFNNMMINLLPNTTDIKMGDLLLSSGMGNRFPSGNKVAEVVRIESLQDQGMINVVARPFAQLDRLGYLLLIPGEQFE